MTSPFQGKWHLYGTQNICAFMDALPLPPAVKCAISQVRITEDIHVNGDDVHVSIGVPAHEIPAYSKEINFHFGTEHDASLPFGGQAKGSIKKESDTKWVGNFKCEKHGAVTITRELLNCEMWVTIEAKGVKTIRKFERPCEWKCPMKGTKECPTKEGTKECPTTCPTKSCFQGPWVLYGSENFEGFMDAIGVPCGLKTLFKNVQVHENIHVNGDNVHLRICIPSVLVPAHTHELAWKIGEEHDLELPFGHKARAKGKKESDTKWTATLTGSMLGETHLTREIRNGEMWVTFDTPRGKCIRKFEKCEPCHKK